MRRCRLKLCLTVRSRLPCFPLASASAFLSASFGSETFSTCEGFDETDVTAGHVSYYGSVSNGMRSCTPSGGCRYSRIIRGPSARRSSVDERHVFASG